MPIGHGVSRFVAATGLNVIAGCEVVVESALENAWLKTEDLRRPRPAVDAERGGSMPLRKSRRVRCHHDVIIQSQSSTWRVENRAAETDAIDTLRRI
jgi:hypothetical protein